MVIRALGAPSAGPTFFKNTFFEKCKLFVPWVLPPGVQHFEKMHFLNAYAFLCILHIVCVFVRILYISYLFPIEIHTF